MSNNLISRPLSMEELQMDHSSNNMDSSMETMQTGVPGIAMNNQISNMQMGGLLQQPMLSEANLPMEPPVVVHSSGVQTFVSPNQQLGSMGHVMINNPSLPIKRSYNGEPLLSKMQHKVNVPGFQQQPPRKIVQANAKLTPSDTQNQLSQNKKTVRIDPVISGRPGSKQVQVPRNRVMQQMESPSPKVRNGSSETVRSKMRESLVAALRLVSLQKNKSLNNEKVENDFTMSEGGQQLEQQLIEKSELSDSVDRLPNTMDKSNDVYIATSQGQGIVQGIVQTWRQGLHVNNENNTPFGDSFFAKDELLQGNGLTWAYDLPMDVETTANETIKEEREEQCPIVLASKIEAELFKFFGGVNKKYKEKGRSLLFNLKDPSNPELREKVISGEISPERLCSMSAEDLASEELSQWRIAKAEELAQMVVLPDSNVRRLVKKTHKGEFQVEVEDDHVVSAEVSIAPSSVSRDYSGSSAAVHKQDTISDKFTIPNDGTDLMQGLMVDDEFKDSDLPPIVSLDEFMESLDAEPPFENLPLDVKKTASPSSSCSPNIKKLASPTTDGAKVDSSSKSKTDESSNMDLKAKASSEAKLIIEDEHNKYENEDSRSIPDDGEKKQAAAASEESKKYVTKIDAVWEGSVQMSVSSSVMMIGCYKSGEKAVINKWTRSLEIKGRVRLDAFEKFVQELPMSRSRAVMIAHFVLKDERSEEDKVIINEAVNSYVVDERLGFAEPETGVEVYFCPPHPRIKALIAKHLIRNSNETTTIDSVNNGLIAVVVWRKVVVISPNSSSAHKHSSENHHFSSTRRQQLVKQQDPILNSKYRPPPSIASARPVVPTVNNNNDDDDDDEVPPGFGPGQIPTREEDDLPEFNFTSGSMPSLPTKVINRSGGVRPIATPKMTRPVSQVRELILKYGQNPSNTSTTTTGFQPWNDDDDDIPEWQPQSEAAQTYPVRQQPMMLPQTNEQFPVRPSIHGSDGRWARPPGPHQLPPTSGGGYYGQLPPKIDRRTEAASRNNRGF
ncbi:uncharacterized protein LOC124926357 [Impatiens glandulifera]|uniref:uncharacterized protein LOC124926357 n=1 Tax=Impatiens glandulifera TaxID=253017 RepID=UPI001FB14A32|nr:uncharacterized protein LOC124926357 [Impatiens glandulifera]XP_047322521.1 uncharacterized protein LOC124926357 [Impatiens glandulifera]